MINFLGHNGRNYLLKKLTEVDTKVLPELQMIIESKPVQQWMDDVTNLTHEDYLAWLSETENDLFGIFFENNLVGFIYYYTSTESSVMEVSYARSDKTDRGFMSEALSVSLGEIKKLHPLIVKVLADIDIQNTKSQAVIMNSGFRYEDGTYVYTFAS